MPSFSYDFTSTGVFKGESKFDTGLFINGKFEEGSGKTIDVVNPTTGKVIGKVAEGTPEGECCARGLLWTSADRCAFLFRCRPCRGCRSEVL